MGHDIVFLIFFILYIGLINSVVFFYTHVTFAVDKSQKTLKT
jgi:hypothetical protein